MSRFQRQRGHRPHDGDDPVVVLYREYRDLVLAYLLRRTRSPELASDLMMEVFAAALIASKEDGVPGDPVKWIFGVARNKLVDSYRRGAAESRAREKLGLEPVALEDEDIRRVDELTDESRVIELVNQLPRKQREAVLAHIVGDDTYDEIARDLGTSALVVRKRVSRGLQHLRTIIEEPE